MREVSKQKANWNSLSVIADNIAKLYGDGLPFVYIFELLSDLDIGDKYKKALFKIKRKIKNGASLEDAFRSEGCIFPDFFVEMVGVGEKTGNIGEVLNGLSLFYSKMAFIKKFLINALSYPLIICISSLGVMIFLSIAIIPNFKEVYISLGKDVPESFNFIINLKTFIFNNKGLSCVYFLLWGVAGPYIIYKVFLKEKFLKLLCLIPIYKRFMEYINIMLLAVVVKSGVNLIKGLEFCSEIKLLGNNNMVVREIKNKIISGNGLSDSMAETKIFSKYTLAHIKLGEESGSLDERLMQIEKFLFNNIQEDLNKKIAMIQPLIIMFIGVFVCIFIVVFILPVFGELI